MLDEPRSPEARKFDRQLATLRRAIAAFEHADTDHAETDSLTDETLDRLSDEVDDSIRQFVATPAATWDQVMIKFGYLAEWIRNEKIDGRCTGPRGFMLSSIEADVVALAHRDGTALWEAEQREAARLSPEQHRAKQGRDCPTMDELFNNHPGLTGRFP